MSPWELAVVQLEAGPFSGSSEGDLEWPFPEDLSKARFVLWDSREHQLWEIFGGQGHAAVSELTKLSVKLESARKQAQFARQLVEVDLQLATEVSFWYLSLPFESFRRLLFSMLVLHRK